MARPALPRSASIAQPVGHDPTVDLRDQPEPFGDRQEAAGAISSLVLIAHSEQQLVLGDGAPASSMIGCASSTSRCSLERGLDPLRPRDAALHVRLRSVVGGEQADAVASGFLGVVHREVGLDQRVFAVHAGLSFERCDTDAGRQRAVEPSDEQTLRAQRRPEGLMRPPRSARSALGSRTRTRRRRAAQARRSIAAATRARGRRA